MHVIESIGPILGIAAFVGLAILAFLLFQQARDIRRLREWAGRAPERAQEAAEAVQAAAEASRGEADAEDAAGEDAGGEPHGTAGRGVGAADGARSASRLAALDRRLPVDGRYLLAVVAVAGRRGRRADQRLRPRRRGATASTTSTAASAKPDGRGAERDAASRASRLWWPSRSSKPAGYKTGTVANAGSSFAKTVVMFAPGHEPQAKKLAKAIKPKLGRHADQGDDGGRHGARRRAPRWRWSWASTTREFGGGSG